MFQWILNLFANTKYHGPIVNDSHVKRFKELFPVEISLNDCDVIVDMKESGTVTVFRPVGATPEIAAEFEQFLQFLMTKRVAYSLLNRRYGQQVNHDRRARELLGAFLAWRSMKAVTDEVGSLKSSMQCIAYRESRSNDWFRCTQQTKSSNGLCRFHNHEGVKTIFTFDMLAKLDHIWEQVGPLPE